MCSLALKIPFFFHFYCQHSKGRTEYWFFFLTQIFEISSTTYGKLPNWKIIVLQFPLSRINPNAAVNFNMDGLKEMLKCASCHRFLFPPILQCINGHMECRNCFDLKPQCGKCSQKMVEIPAKFAEMITEQFNVQCSYAEKGCTESVAFKVRWELKGRPLKKMGKGQDLVFWYHFTLFV